MSAPLSVLSMLFDSSISVLKVMYRWVCWVTLLLWQCAFMTCSSHFTECSLTPMVWSTESGRTAQHQVCCCWWIKSATKRHHWATQPLHLRSTLCQCISSLIHDNALNLILSQEVVLRGTTVLPRYHFSTVPVPLALRYYLVPQYHNYRGSSARYCPMLSHSNEHSVRLHCIWTQVAIFGLSSVVHC